MNNALYDDENDKLKFENDYLKAEIERFKKNNSTLISELYGNTNKSKSSKSDNIEYRHQEKNKPNFGNFNEMPHIEPKITKREHTRTFKINNEPIKPTNSEPIKLKKKQENTKSYKKKYFIIGLAFIFFLAFITSFVLVLSGGKKINLVPEGRVSVTQQIKSENNVVPKNDELTPNPQIVELNQRIIDLNDANISLGNKQKVYEYQISELTKKSEKLYYPVSNPSDKNSFDYVYRVLKNWQPIMKYKENVYDCSNMSAHLQWFLEANNIKAKIVVGKPTWAKTTHAWVFAYGDFGKIAIETTTKSIVFNGGFHLFQTSDPSYYNEKNIYNLYDSIFSISDSEKQEFEWWNNIKGVS